MRPLSPSQKRGLALAAETYEAAMPGSPAEEYLQARGIDPSSCGGVHRLGYVRDPLPGHENLTGRLYIPNICAAGTVVGGKARALGPDDGPKYLGLPGMDSRLYNLRALDTPSDLIVLTEGELDAVTIEMHLGLPAVAVPGAKTWRPHHVRIFEDYEEVVVVRDGDGPGGDLAGAIARSTLPVRVVMPPGGKDTNDAVVAGLGDVLLKAIMGDAA